MLVDKTNCKDILEQYDELEARMIILDQRLPWDFEFNQLNAHNILTERITKKMNKLADSEEGREYNLKRVM